MNKTELKMSLQEIRDKINLSFHPWINGDKSNCYAYALGLDVNETEIISYAFNPGVISGATDVIWSDDIFGYEDLLLGIGADLDALGIEFKKVSPLYCTKEGEWKIALFVDGYRGVLEDFHFLRQNEDGVWYHKDGYLGEVTNRDDNGNIILNPEKYFFTYRDYYACYSLRLR